MTPLPVRELEVTFDNLDLGAAPDSRLGRYPQGSRSTPTMTMNFGLHLVLNDIEYERGQQDAKWGQRNHPDGTGANVCWADGLGNLPGAAAVAQDVRETCQGHFALQIGTWLDIALEEVAEAFAEDDPALLRTELVQAAAVFVAWIEAIDRNLAPDAG